ncbi:MAG: tRNA (adenosine(37)-N6)-dimethylallyltransferase MiaA [Candidatus Sungiibacteriota bacterium]
MKKQKLIVIVGPTASGKSALAVRIAKKFNGEIISADSRQIYRGLDIGTGKVPGAWKNPASVQKNHVNKSLRSYEFVDMMFIYNGIPHHCVDIVSPRRVFTAAQFVARARRAIADIARRGCIPIIAGGTAFWIDALVYNFSLPAVKPNARLRRVLEKKSPSQLLAILKKLDPRRAAEIEQKNPRRLIRAIEIAQALGRVPQLKRKSTYNALWIGLKLSYEAGPRKIEKRVRGMIRQGLIAETKKLLRHRVSEKRIREFGFEYAAALDTIAKKIPHTALAPRLVRDTLHYARRQMRWWKRNADIRWITMPTQAILPVKTFLQKNP